MINENLYHKTISILVKAYLNDTLIHGNCQACAVGNLVAGNLGYKYEDYLDAHGDWDRVKWTQTPTCNDEIHWYKVLGTSGHLPFIAKENYHGEAKKQIDSTGYTIEELAKIEKVFEAKHTGIASKKLQDMYMYKGLMAVVEALGEIHQVDKEETEKSKLLFVKP